VFLWFSFLKLKKNRNKISKAKSKKTILIQFESIQKSFQKRIFSMAASYLPSILVPLVGLVFPAVAMASLFLYIEKEEIV
jgi:photosystem I subunit 8